MSVPMNWELLLQLPAAYCPDAAVQIGSNLLPGIQPAFRGNSYDLRPATHGVFIIQLVRPFWDIGISHLRQTLPQVVMSFNVFSLALLLLQLSSNTCWRPVAIAAPEIEFSESLRKFRKSLTGGTMVHYSASLGRLCCTLMLTLVLSVSGSAGSITIGLYADSGTSPGSTPHGDCHTQ
jgi:hypothetical protein